MNKKLILLTGYNHFFGQTRKPWVSLKTDALIKYLVELGYKVQEIPFNQVANRTVVISDSIVFYTFSQRDNLRSYIKDTVYDLSMQGNILIPTYELLLCHENKGFQELLKSRLGIGDLAFQYFSSKRELTDYKIDYPCVMKTITGSNATGVHLVRSQMQLYNTIKSLEPKQNILTKLDFLRRRYLRNKTFPEYTEYTMKEDYLQYKDYITPEICFILQEFVPELKFDYRVIIMGDRYYVSKRMIREGDFRASGAKQFRFDFDIPIELLNYSQNIYDKLETPTLALDIGEKDGRFYLFELMAISFGINAIVKAPHHYINIDGAWVEDKSLLKFEKLLADSVNHYLQSKGIV